MPAISDRSSLGLTGIARNWQRSRPNSNQLRPTLADAGQILAEFGKHTDRVRRHVCKLWPTSNHDGQHSWSDFNCIWSSVADLGYISARVGRLAPNIRSRSNCSTTVLQQRMSLGALGVVFTTRMASNCSACPRQFYDIRRTWPFRGRRAIWSPTSHMRAPFLNWHRCLFTTGTSPALPITTKSAKMLNLRRRFDIACTQGGLVDTQPTSRRCRRFDVQGLAHKGT